MKKLLAVLLCIMMIAGFAACGGKEDEADNVFTVGMECNYAPYNWTQTEATDRSVPIKDGVASSSVRHLTAVWHTVWIASLACSLAWTASVTASHSQRTTKVAM